MSETRKPRGAYGSGQATKEAILAASTDLFGERGFYGFSLRDVAKRVGISHPAVIYHFPTKEALLYSTMSRWHREVGLGEIRIHPGTGDTIIDGPETELLRPALALLRLGDRSDFQSLARFDVTMSSEAASDEHPLHNHYATRMQGLFELLASQLPTLIEQGWCKPALSIKETATAMMAAWYGVLCVQNYLQQPMNGQDIVGEALAMMAKLLGVDADHLLACAVMIPDDLAAPFQRVLRFSREIFVGTDQY